MAIWTHKANRGIIPGMRTESLNSLAFWCISLCLKYEYCLYRFPRLLVGAPKGNTTELQNLGVTNPGVVMQCDFKNELGCSALPFETEGKIKVIYFVL